MVPIPISERIPNYSFSLADVPYEGATRGAKRLTLVATPKDEKGDVSPVGCLFPPELSHRGGFKIGKWFKPEDKIVCDS